MDNSIGVFVDIISIHKNIKRLYGSKLDYKAYLEKISKEGRIVRAFAYGAQVESEATKFISFLKAIGFEPKYCRAREEHIYPENLLKSIEDVFELESNDPVFNYLKGKIDIKERVTIPSVQSTDRMMDMIVDMLRVVRRIDTIVIGSSNTKIAPIIRFLKEEGVKVIVFSANIPRSLRYKADVCWEITDKFLEKVPDKVES